MLGLQIGSKIGMNTLAAKTPADNSKIPTCYGMNKLRTFRLLEDGVIMI